MPQNLESLLTVDTPERVQIEFDLAGIGSRALAQVIDLTLMFFAVIALLYLFFARFTLSWESGSTTLVLFTLGGFLIQWGYFFFFEAFANGRTPGKKLCGIRVMMDDGVPVTMMASLVRNLVRVVDFLPAGYAFGFLFMFLNPQSRRIGDLAAGTLVVRESKLTLEELSKSVTELSNTETALSPLAAEIIISFEEYNLITDFLGRSKDLDEQERYALSIDIAKPFLSRATLTGENLQAVHPNADRYEKFLIELAKIFVVRQGIARR